MRRIRPLHGVHVGWLMPIASALLACAAQVDGEYKGEPIMTLHGVVASRSELKSDTDVSAAIVWFGGSSPPGPRYTGERVEVIESFPASFSLRLYGPPPAEAEAKLPTDFCANDRGELRSLGRGQTCDDVDFQDPDSAREVLHAGSRLGFWSGAVAAIDSSIPDGEISPDDIVGIDIDHLIYYFDHSGPASEPDPSTVTPLERYRYGFVTGNYPPSLRVGYERGYHLAKYTPEFEKARIERRDCEWEALCVHWIEMHGADVPASSYEWKQERADWQFDRCQERFPDNPTCSASRDSVDDEPASSIECRELYESSADRDCNFPTTGPSMVEKAEGLDDPLKIQLGLGYWDAAQFQ